jgi:hypothetical protein
MARDQHGLYRTAPLFTQLHGNFGSHRPPIEGRYLHSYYGQCYLGRCGRSFRHPGIREARHPLNVSCDAYGARSSRPVEDLMEVGARVQSG